jgi:hypothetical protein
MESGAKSYIMKVFRGNLQILSLVIYDFAPDPSEFPNTVYEENFIFYFISGGDEQQHAAFKKKFASKRNEAKRERFLIFMSAK